MQKTLVFPISIVLLLACAQLQPGAFADETQQLALETPATDSGQSVQPGASAMDSGQIAQPGPQTETLTGSAHKSEWQVDATAQSGKSALNGQAADGSAQFQSEVAAADPVALFQLAAKKVAAKGQLTADDYRNLGIGILGYESDRTYFQTEARVSKVYPGCPADLAGMKVGDIILLKHVDDSKVKDPTVPAWVFSCGAVGKPLDLTVKRKGQILNLHLVRMNMEDVPDARLRKQYEHMVQETGAPVHNAPLPSHITPMSIFRVLTGL